MAKQAPLPFKEVVHALPPSATAALEVALRSAAAAAAASNDGKEEEEEEEEEEEAEGRGEG
eukprot:evm.model.NODE_34652_length_3291_cov_4.996050.1